MQAHGSDAMVDEENCVFFLPHRPRSQICEPPLFLFMKGTGKGALSLCYYYNSLLPMYNMHLCGDWFSLNYESQFPMNPLEYNHQTQHRVIILTTATIDYSFFLLAWLFVLQCICLISILLALLLHLLTNFTYRLVWCGSWSLWAPDRPSFFICFPGEGCSGTLRIFVLQFWGLEVK